MSVEDGSECAGLISYEVPVDGNHLFFLSGRKNFTHWCVTTTDQHHGGVTISLAISVQNNSFLFVATTANRVEKVS